MIRMENTNITMTSCDADMLRSEHFDEVVESWMDRPLANGTPKTGNEHGSNRPLDPLDG